MDYEPDMNVISVLQKIAAQAQTVDGRPVAPVAWDCNCLEEVCGACTMVINGRVRQACTALVDRLLEDRPEGIELRPMTKFPVRPRPGGRPLADVSTLQKIQAWVPVDSYHDMGPGPRVRRSRRWPIRCRKCMSCGCCLEACPQYLKIERAPADGRDGRGVPARRKAEFDRGFIGAFAIGQVELFNTHPIGRHDRAERLDALIAEGGIQVCGNAQNCVRSAPRNPADHLDRPPAAPPRCTR